MRFFTLLLILILILSAASADHGHEITTVFSKQTADISLYGVQVEVNTASDISDILAQYQYDAYPLPETFIPYIDEIIIIPQSEIDREFSENTSGYTRSYFIDDLYSGSTIYLSDSLFRKTTLLHEALHVIDAQFQFSVSENFQNICTAEINAEYNSRILDYYDPLYHCSEYFVESYINYLYDTETFKQLQPITFRLIEEAEKRISS